MNESNNTLFPLLVRKDSNVFVKKPLPLDETTCLVRADSISYESFDDKSYNSSRSLQRHLKLKDLVMIGVGGTIGSGLFVICGLITNQYAGPASIISWIISGGAALISGICYAELSSRIPLAGSAYAYTFVAMGELPAVIAATCLSLDYIAAAAAVSRSWSDKVVAWISTDSRFDDWVPWFVNNEYSSNVLALIASTTTVLLLMAGVEGSKRVTNFFTKLKVAIVVFMIISALFLMKPSNFEPFLPAQFGGIFRGATATFFGYLGYDEICALGQEVENPKANLPKAIFLTLSSVTALYILATIALVGMVDYRDISPVSGFPIAFRDSGAPVAAQIAAIGEILTLPIVILITLIGQPRLQYALSKDGLLPEFFSELDENGNLTKGTFCCGFIMIITATFMEFEHLNDMISCAVLTALTLTDSSLILLWYPSPKEKERSSESIIGIFICGALLTGVSLSHFASTRIGMIIAAACSIIMIGCVFSLVYWCPRAKVFGEKSFSLSLKPIQDDDFFRTPFMPYLPFIGIFINLYLISQLQLKGVCLFLGFLALAILYYMFYAINYSVGNNGGWYRESRQESIASFGTVDNDSD